MDTKVMAERVAAGFMKTAFERKAWDYMNVDELPDKILEGLRRAGVSINGLKLWRASSGNIMVETRHAVLGANDLKKLVGSGMLALMGDNLSMSFKD